MKKINAILLVVFLASCNNEESYTASNNYQQSNPVTTGNPLHQSYRKTGNIIMFENNLEKKNIIMWDNYFGQKKAVYHFNPGEPVVVYGKKGEYLFLSPQKDTALAGYILAGWIEFDDVNKVNHQRIIASIPEYQPRAANISDNEMKTNEPNLEKIMKKQEKKLKIAPVVFDEKHILQEDLELPKRTDSIKLFFEKH